MVTTQKADWQSVEIAGYKYFSERGYRVLVSLVRNEGYDMAIEKGGRFTRVNVKVAYDAKGNGNRTWYISVGHTLGKKMKGAGIKEKTKALKDTVDLFLVWLPGHDVFIEVESGFMAVGSSRNVRIPNEFIPAGEVLAEERGIRKLEQQGLAKKGLKKCSRCGEIKTFGEMCKNPRRPNGLHSRCKKCKNTYWAEYKSAARGAEAKKEGKGCVAVTREKEAR